MSDFVVAPLPETHIRPAERLRATAAVICARALAALKPSQLEKVMRRLSSRTTPAGIEEALRARIVVTSISTRCAGRWCLDRSIATALLCRLNGTWPEWNTGVCTQPFRAHAWVAVEGQPIGEPSGLGDTFESMMTVASPGRTP
jgi:hypothetical protein